MGRGSVAVVWRVSQAHRDDGGVPTKPRQMPALARRLALLSNFLTANGRHIVKQDDVNVCTDAKLRRNTTGSIVYLGSFKSHSDCETATLSLPDSTAYFYADKNYLSDSDGLKNSWAEGCYARTDGRYVAKKAKHCSSGRVIADGPPSPPAPTPPGPPPSPPAPPTPTPPTPPGKKCPGSCSMNGICTASGECQCDPAWVGNECQTLAILPAEKASGLRQIDVPAGGPNGTIAGNTSTWGGAVLYDPKYLLRGICIHNKSRNLPLIWCLNYAYISSGAAGTSSGSCGPPSSPRTAGCTHGPRNPTQSGRPPPRRWGCTYSGEYVYITQATICP